MAKTQVYRMAGSSLGLAAAVVAGMGFWTTNAAAAAAPEPEKPKSWERTASVGLTLTKGNSDSYQLNAGLNASRKWERDELLLGANAGYGKTKDVQTGDSTKTAEYLSGFGQWNHLFTERWYGGGRLEGLHDGIAGIDYRFTLSPLAGYYLLKEKRTTLSVEAGPSFIYEKRGGDTKGYMGLRAAERFEHKFNDRARLWQTAEYIPQVDDFDNYLVNAELGVDTKITKSISLRVVLQDNYVNRPAPGRKSNDVKLIAGVAYSF